MNKFPECKYSNKIIFFFFSFFFVLSLKEFYITNYVECFKFLKLAIAIKIEKLSTKVYFSVLVLLD